MSVAEVRTLLDGALPEPQNPACDHVRPSHARGDVLLMFVNGELARVEVRDTSVRTSEGAQVGDAEARIEALYERRVTSQPHKYVDGRYLIVQASRPDTGFRLVFETDGREVTRYRSGRIPEVDWVEGCA